MGLIQNELVSMLMVMKEHVTQSNGVAHCVFNGLLTTMEVYCIERNKRNKLYCVRLWLHR